LTTVKIKKLHPDAKMPEYAHNRPDENAGMDIRALHDCMLMPGMPEAIPTGLSMEIPSFHELQIRSRSGLTLKGVVVANAPGTIDAGYRGEVKIILLNQGRKPYHVAAGDKIAQGVLATYQGAWFEEVTELAESTRAGGGFGSTGV
jgi:dUTP pyrophosphatase